MYLNTNTRTKTNIHVHVRNKTKQNHQAQKKKHCRESLLNVTVEILMDYKFWDCTNIPFELSQNTRLCT